MTVRQPTEERRRQIADAALTLIAERGLGKFTTAAVASLVGLSDGALFRHFKNKRAIVLAVIQSIEDRLFEGPLPSDGDPLDRLEAFVRRRVRLLVDNPSIMRLVFSEQLVQASGDEGNALVRRMQKRSIGFIRDRLLEAEAAGLLREGLSADHLTIVVYGSIFGVCYRSVYEDELPKDIVRDLPGDIWLTLDTLIRR